jgi:hypothetical protein
MDGGAPISAWLLVISFWSLPSAYSIWLLRPLIRPVRLETLSLGDHELRYDPGNLGPALFRFGFFVEFSYRGAWGLRTFVMPKAELHVKLTDDVWRRRGRRLIILRNEQEIELGRCLTDVQRSRSFKNGVTRRQIDRPLRRLRSLAFHPSFAQHL